MTMRERVNNVVLECKIPCHLIKYAKEVIIFMTNLHVLYIIHGQDYVEGAL